MLTIILPEVGTNPALSHTLESAMDETVFVPSVKLNFEHSLLSLSKWEGIHEKPFFGREQLTKEEMLSYFRQMILTDDPPENFHKRLKSTDFEVLSAYINSKHTATTFREDPNSKSSSEIITSEVIYYWMVQFQIPWDAQYWHLNRLMTLIKICGIKQTKPKKMSRSAIQQQYHSLNAQRRQQLGTTG